MEKHNIKMFGFIWKMFIGFASFGESLAMCVYESREKVLGDQVFFVCFNFIADSHRRLSFENKFNHNSKHQLVVYFISNFSSYFVLLCFVITKSESSNYAITVLYFYHRFKILITKRKKNWWRGQKRKACWISCKSTEQQRTWWWKWKCGAIKGCDKRNEK